MIAIVYGTRPEYLKLMPLLDEFDYQDVEYELFQVQQHSDLIKDFPYDKQITVWETGNRLQDIFGSVLAYPFSKDLDYIMVHGDTTTAMAVAMNGFLNKIPIMHLEAGLRTYNKENPWPEEINRRIISLLASVHFCPTTKDQGNLWDEEHQKTDKIFNTGNTIIDNIANLEPDDSNVCLVTMHRRENQPNMKAWFLAIERIANENKDLEFIFPMHPSPAVQEYRNIFDSVRVIDPLGYPEMLSYISKCRVIITDSGGIQEEGSWFKKPVIVCREVTERPTTTSILCETPEALVARFSQYKDLDLNVECPFGDGNASRKITDHIQDLLGRVRETTV